MGRMQASLQLRLRRFPVTPIKVPDFYICKSRLVNTTKVNADTVWIGPGDVEGLDAADTAKMMFGNMGLESIGRRISRQ